MTTYKDGTRIACLVRLVESVVQFYIFLLEFRKRLCLLFFAILSHTAHKKYGLAVDAPGMRN